MSGLPPVQIPQPLMSPVPGIGGAGGNYVPAVSFNWDSLPGKPATFPPSAHAHSVGDISGLSGTLSGLQTQIDGKQPLGSYVTTTNFTWANLADKPTSFTPSAHTHVIGDVPGLQAALDGKAAVSHTHSYLPLSGGTITGQLKAPDVQIEFSSGTLWSTLLASPWDNPAEVLNLNTNGVAAITFHVANKYANLLGYDENNILKTNNSIIWHSGNFNPDSKQAALGYTPVNRGGDTMTGSLTMSSSPIILAFSGSLPYMDLQSTGVSGGRNYRIRSGIEGVSNGGFSIKDLTSGNNVLGADEGGVVYAYNGLTVSGGAVYRADWTTDFQSQSDFVDGTLVTTNIPATDLHGDSFEIEITGKSYNAANPPMKVIAGGYLYNGGIIAASGISYGGDFADTIKVFEEGGVLKFWWPRVSYWNSFRVSVVASISPTNGTITRNRVTAISNSTEPTGTKKVTISLHRTIKSDPGSFTHIHRPYANLLSLYNTGGTGTRIQLADNVWAANIRHDSGNLMFQTQGENTRLFLGNGVVGIGTGNTSDSALRVLSSTGAGFRVGFNGSAENYYDAGYHAIRHITGAAIMEMYPSTIYARQDLYATSGNIFVRENPSGAGAGMRLHHSGGGAYIDFDGNLNFRTGEGSGIASLNSDGAFIASNVIGTEQLRVGGYTSATGFMNFSNGNAGNPGYAAWYSADGVRRGYMGWSEGSNIVYQAENGWGLKFNSNVSHGNYVDILGGNLRINSHDTDSNMGAYIGFRNPVNGERGWVGYGEGNNRMRVNNSIGSVWVAGSDVQLHNGNGNTTRIVTTSGYVDVGPINSGYCHYLTDRPAHYFNTHVEVNGVLKRYTQGAFLHHSSMGSGVITTSTSAPSGGSDGDIWLKVT